MAELKARITLCFKKLPRDQVRCACSRFQSRLKTVVEVRGVLRVESKPTQYRHYF
ncbi:Hypothetical protein FKW44_025313 [Caligus rogercresseyi]|uniref:Uncharacterized protein n=1 Tax=Caligus rogercresseyi TaxID=217165 RepID=A0A7T8GKM5_CALRO|nr:Hypothetical protein FKW44_025313 [Caligus rogercresseyi]